VTPDELASELKDLERRLAAIEVEGSPNMRERVARLEGKVNHIIDPEVGVYPTVRQTTERLRSWALVILTALILNLLGLLIHVVFERAK
jgi:hypothetical protein